MGFYQGHAANLGGPRYSEAPEFRMPTMPVGPNPLAEAFGALGRSAGESFSNRIQNEMKQRMLDKVLSQVRPGMSAQEKLSLLASPELPQEQRGALQFLFEQQQAQDLAEAKAMQEEQAYQRAIEAERRKQQFEKEKLGLQHKYKMEEQEKKEAAKVKKGGPASKISEEEKADVQTTFDRMSDLLKQGRLGNPLTTGGVFNRQRQEDMAEFDSLNIKLESIAKEMVSKGVLAKDRFKFMMDNLPHSSDSDRANKGKLKAIAQILGLDAAELTGESKKEGKKRTFAKTPPAKMFKGKKIVNPMTGETLISNGKEWVKE